MNCSGSSTEAPALFICRHSRGPHFVGSEKQIPLGSIKLRVCLAAIGSMNISEQLTCLFSAEVEARDDSYVVEVPKQEVDVGYVDPTEAYQLAMFEVPTDQESPSLSNEPESDHDNDHETDPDPDPDHNHDRPPVNEGDTRVVEIKEIGDQGDGLARVDRGYVVIVPETQMGERVKIEIETVRENVAFGRVVDRVDHPSE